MDKICGVNFESIKIGRQWQVTAEFNGVHAVETGSSKGVAIGYAARTLSDTLDKMSVNTLSALVLVPQLPVSAPPPPKIYQATAGKRKGQSGAFVRKVKYPDDDVIKYLIRYADGAEIAEDPKYLVEWIQEVEVA